MQVTPDPISIRHANQSNARNRDRLITLIKDARCTAVYLFASPMHKSPDFNAASDGSESSLPLLAALALCEVKGGATVRMVFDGDFLNASTPERYQEVKDVLDAAQQTEKVFFTKHRVPFTSTMTPALAALTLQELTTPSKLLNSETRPQFFSRLNLMTEEEFNAESTVA